MINRYQSRMTSKQSESPSKNKINSNKVDQECINKNLNINNIELPKNKYNQKPKTTENVQRIS